MSTWREMDVRDKVVVWIAGIIGLFLILSLVGVFALAITDRETGAIWDRVFELVGVLSGGLVGFIAGAQTEKAKRRGP